MLAKRLFLASLGLCAVSGCPSLSTMQTPSTVPKGNVRLGFSAEQVKFTDGDVAITLPQIEMTVRYGLTDDLDVGGKLYLVGAEAGIKYQFLRGPLDLAIAPAASYFGVSSNGTTSTGEPATGGISVIGLHVPLLMGFNVNDRLTIGFGPKFLYLITTASAQSGSATASDSSGTALIGGFFNLPIRVGKAAWIAPEINVYKAMSGTIPGLLWQGGVAFLFGGAPQNTAPPL
jgi:hypothetical protein